MNIMKKKNIITCLVAVCMALACSSCRTHRVAVISEYKGDSEPLGEWVKCSKCDGSGACKKCKGTGDNESCSACNGTGICSSCKGQGGHRDS